MSRRQLLHVRRLPLLMLMLGLQACGGSDAGGGDAKVLVGSDNKVAAVAGTDLNYYDHAKSILDTRCVTCHNPGGQAPFSLVAYSEVVTKKSAITYVLESGRMPPVGFSAVTAAEQSLLLDWLKAGATEGQVKPVLQSTAYTYYGHAKAIIEDKCSSCHSPGNIAPFNLLDYDSVYAVRAAIAHQIDAGAMPPWPPTEHYLSLRNSRSLSDEEHAVLMGWIQTGAPAGQLKDYDPAVTGELQIDYNLNIGINEPYTPSTIPDEYRCLMIDWPLDETVYVNAVNVIPDVKEQVHHVFAVIVDPENVHIFADADGADGKPGFPCWGAPSPLGALVPPRTLTVWAPGITAGELPAGTGVRVDPGSKIAMQMHYNTINTEPKPDQSRLDIRYVDAVDREALTLFFLDVDWYPTGGMPIPANDPNVTHQFVGNLSWPISFSGGASIGLTADDPVAMHSVFMHQHVLGKSASIELLRDDGTEVMLVDIRDWDFGWQDEYVFEEEVIIQPGERLRLTCTWDNSASNQQFINGKQIKPQYVEFGEGTLDEMCVNYFYVTKVRPQDKNRLQEFPPTVGFGQPKHLQVFNPGDYVPVELLFNAFKLQEPLASHADHGHMDAAEDAYSSHRHHSGHYHLYLDSEDDAAAHLTSWDNSTFYELPQDIAPGKHTLRVSLRNDNHEAIGVEERRQFIVDEPSAVDDGRKQLVEAADWHPVPAARDPLASHRPAEGNCPDNAWYEEDGALEVQTGYCNYLSLSQPSKATINKGDDLHLVLWHSQLRFDEPAEAHAAISVGGTVIWENLIEIPNKGGIYDITVPSTVAAAVGEMIEYHLHNHGNNTWTLLSFGVSSPKG